MYGAAPTADCKAFIIAPFAMERRVNWMNLKRKMAALTHDVRCAIHGVAPEAAQRERSWRRRSLSRKGAQLYSAMQASSQTGSLAMLDEGGMVVAWYERAERASSAESVIDTHMSQFYVAEDRALGVPVRDLCSAAIHGRSTQTGWRRFPQGAICWATTVIEPVWLRDGQLQGFSHVTRRAPNTPQNVGADKPKLTLHLQKIRAHAAAHSTAMLAALALMVAGDFGNSWNCERGFSRGTATCDAIQLPENSHLSYSGDTWRCDSGFSRQAERCIRE